MRPSPNILRRTAAGALIVAASLFAGGCTGDAAAPASSPVAAETSADAGPTLVADAGQTLVADAGPDRGTAETAGAERGAQGETGARGERGPTGEAGTRGERGPRGETGTQGERGPQGETGARGERGPQGEPGASGNRGPQGAAGTQGERGPRGATGATGEPGPRGEGGRQGERGPTGDTGARGLEGEPGAPGERGPQGDRGLQGERGPQGARGPQGEPGDAVCPPIPADVVTPSMKLQEAVYVMGEVADAFKFFYTKPGYSPQGIKLPCEFPVDAAEWTPPGSPCDTGTGHFTSPPSDWLAPAWQARYLLFPGDLYFQYRYETAPDGQSVAIMARGDLDCDGEWSLLQVVVQGHQDPAGCWVSGNLGVIADNPYE